MLRLFSPLGNGPGRAREINEKRPKLQPFAAMLQRHWRSEERRVGKEKRSYGDWSSDVCSSDLGGEMVGGAAKAQGTTFLFTDGPWVYKFNADQLSCCDCFHPSATGQDALAKLMKNGLSCSRLQPCCKDT